MKKSILTIAALAFMAWGCSSDDSDSGSQPNPSQQEIVAGNDARPSWESPNYDLFEQTMLIEVQLQDTLVKYASPQDLMCAVVNSEVRGVAPVFQQDDNWLFPLIIASNEANVFIELKYYCDRLHRIFTIEKWTRFDSEIAPTGAEGIYKPAFVK